MTDRLVAAYLTVLLGLFVAVHISAFVDVLSDCTYWLSIAFGVLFFLGVAPVLAMAVYTIGRGRP